MRKALLLFSILCAATGLGQSSAGQSSSANPTHARHRAMPGGERNMRGCIVQDQNGNYLLAPLRGVKVRLSSSDDVSKHVGHQVRVSGAFVDADESNSATPSGSPGSSQSTAKTRVVREFRVIKVDVISQTCNASGKKK